MQANVSSSIEEVILSGYKTTLLCGVVAPRETAYSEGYNLLVRAIAM